jgi:sugar phosphate isomerase/epimerase
MKAMTRRVFLSAAPAALAQANGTEFQIGCMTLPYSSFEWARALRGIRSAGYKFVAWGTTHTGAAGNRYPVLALDAPEARARELAAQCKDEGLASVMMFSTVMLEAPAAADGHKRRIAHAAAAGIPYLLTFGKTEKGAYENVIRCLKETAPAARAAGVTILIKQHGGNTATGQDCARILDEVGDAAVKICYDAGNVLDYENHDPIPDIRKCWPGVRAFAIKDHRNWPKDEDCGPGFGEIDHYRLLEPALKLGLKVPLVCENIFEPLVPRPTSPEGVDALAHRARLYLETVTAGLKRMGSL